MSDNPEPVDHATIRRAPKLSMFLLVGGALGAAVTFILTAIYPVDPQVGFGPLLGYFMLYGIPAGVVLGAIVGLILDRRSRRRATGVSVEHENVVDPEDSDNPER
ncbi:MAG TPA: potassium transporter Trk [Homoserinimonas sp.]|nr:potassium transporter Trk [Homoserinimonas sp.]